MCLPVNEVELELFNDNQINILLKRIWEGSTTLRNLDYDQYLIIARKLFEGVQLGYGKKLVEVAWGSPDYTMLTSLRENVYIFSGAKSYQATKDISKLLYTDKGLKPLSQFLEDAKPHFQKYNKTYLTTEYNSAITQARQASNWKDYEKEAHVYEQLQYKTVGDDRVRPEHQLLDNIIKPVNDPFWSKFYPPNSWNCRCYVIQVSGRKNTPPSKTPSVEVVDEIFRFNSGKSKIIYSKKHPYFNVAKADKEFAKTNYGLPLPKI